MATVTIQPTNFSTSTSSFRASQSQPPAAFSYSDSQLTQLPNVDLNFEDLRQRMAAFTAKFDAFIERGRKRVLEERNDFRARLGELNEDQKSTTTQVATLQSSLATHTQVLARESSEKSDMHTQIAKLDSHHSTQLSARDRLRTAIAHTRRQIDSKLQAQKEYGEKVDRQTGHNGPELTFWEHYLGCRIDGGGDENKVKVTFAFQPPKGGGGGGGGGGAKSGAAPGVGGIVGTAAEREAEFDLQIPDSTSGAFAITYTKPRLENARVARVVEGLNQSRDIATLLKGMRALFVEAVR